MPRSAYIVARVMMNGGRPICITPKAWKTPISTPTARVIVTAPVIVEAKPRSWAISQATVIDMTPAIAPTDRSMPPVMMTKVSPMARMAIIAPCLSRLAMLLEVQKVVVSTDSATHIAINSKSSVSPNRRLTPAPLRRTPETVCSLIPQPSLSRVQTPIASVKIVSCEAPL